MAALLLDPLFACDYAKGGIEKVLQSEEHVRDRYAMTNVLRLASASHPRVLAISTKFSVPLARLIIDTDGQLNLFFR